MTSLDIVGCGRAASEVGGQKSNKIGLRISNNYRNPPRKSNFFIDNSDHISGFGKENIKFSHPIPSLSWPVWKKSLGYLLATKKPPHPSP